MYRLSGTIGQTIRLVQDTNATSISIIFQDGTVVVANAPTKQIGSLSIRFFDFVPSQKGTYLIRWNGAEPNREWEVIDIEVNSLRWIIEQIKTRTDGLPSAFTA